MVAKLKIDLSQGVLEVEGDEDFVREIHEAFRSYAAPSAALRGGTSYVGAPQASTTSPESTGEQASVAQQKKRSVSRRPRAAAQEGSIRPTQYAPSVIRDLDLKGLKEFVAPYVLSGHSDKILAYAMFLREKKGLDPVSADHIYTAYRFVGERTPGAFLQAIRDASKKKDLVDYQSPTHISVTHIGENRFLHDLPKAGTDK